MEIEEERQKENNLDDGNELEGGEEELRGNMLKGKP